MTESEFDIASFRQVVGNHWRHHGKCRHLNWSDFQKDDGVWQIEVAPVFQEVYGGENDGKKVWAGFEFDLAAFLAEPSIEVEDFGACSACMDCNPRPMIAVKGTFAELPFVLKLNLEPVQDTEPVELLDTIHQEVRPLKENDDELDF